MRRLQVLVLALLLATAGSCQPRAATDAASPATPARTAPVELTIVGTNDLHGHIERLPLLAGYFEVLRDQGRNLIPIDGGDMFQGTLASNLLEGAPIVEAYGAMGYRAVAIGNHEFDFGPVGDAVVASKPGEDPRGALKARASEAPFPFVSANVVHESGEPVDWDNVVAQTMIEVAGVKVGITGITTETTPRSTLAANFEGLRIAALADTVRARATELRRRGAEVVVVAAHAGALCHHFDDPDDTSSCKGDEIFPVAEALPPGLVDVIVGGHTHAGVAHRVNGIVIIESYAKGTAFGRVDLTVDPDGRVSQQRIHPPRNLCDDHEASVADCEPGLYEGAEVVADPEVARIAAAAAARAASVTEASLGVSVTEAVTRSRSHESALGNLFGDLMLAARPDADVALMNGGGLRADLPAGDLSYGDLYEAMPFDNRFAFVRLSGADFERLLAANLRGDTGILSLAGVLAQARCEGGELAVSVTRADGSPVRDDEVLVIVTSDFLASGGDDLFGALDLDPGAIRFEDGETIRDAMADVLRERDGSLDGRARALYDPARRRFSYPGERPVRCASVTDR